MPSFASTSKMALGLFCLLNTASTAVIAPRDVTVTVTVTVTAEGAPAGYYGAPPTTTPRVCGSSSSSSTSTSAYSSTSTYSSSSTSTAKYPGTTSSKVSTPLPSTTAYEVSSPPPADTGYGSTTTSSPAAGTRSGSYPSNFPYVTVGTPSTLTASGSSDDACTAVITLAFNKVAQETFLDCDHSYLQTTTLTYSADCGGCGAVSPTYSTGLEFCPMGPRITVTTVSDIPKTSWAVACSATPTPAPAGTY